MELNEAANLLRGCIADTEQSIATGHREVAKAHLTGCAKKILEAFPDAEVTDPKKDPEAPTAGGEQQ